MSSLGTSWDRFDAFLQRRPLLTSPLVGIAFLALAMLYTHAASGPVEQGVSYQILSTHPLDLGFVSPVRLRVLTPLLAHALGFSGDRYVPFTFLLCAVFIGVVFYSFVRRYRTWVALTAAAAVAFNSPVLFQLHFAGYVDVTQCILFWLVHETRGTRWSPAFAGLTLFNHPSAVFFIPWFLFLWTRQTPHGLRNFCLDAGLLVGFLVLYRCWEAYVLGHTQVPLNVGFYANIENIRRETSLQIYYGWLGIFMGLKLFWAMMFFGFMIRVSNDQRWEAADLAIPVLCALSQLFFVSDTSRHIHLAFPAVLLGIRAVAEEAAKKRLEPSLKRAFAYLVVFNLLTPQYYVGQSQIVGYFSPLHDFARSRIFGVNVDKGWSFRSPRRY